MYKSIGLKFGCDATTQLPWSKVDCSAVLDWESETALQDTPDDLRKAVDDEAGEQPAGYSSVP